MAYFSEKFMAHLTSIGWKPYDVWKFFKTQPVGERLSENYIYKFCRGEPIKEEKVLEKLSKVEGLGLSIEELRAWWLLDQATFEEKLVIFRELATDNELLPLVRQVLKEKKG